MWLDLYNLPQVIELGIYTITLDLTEKEKERRRADRLEEDRMHLERARHSEPGASLWLIGRHSAIDSTTGKLLFELLGTTQEEVESLAHQWHVQKATERLALLRDEVAQSKSWEAEGSSYFLQLYFSESDHRGLNKNPWEIVDPSEIGLTALEVKKLPTPRRPHEGKG